MLRSTLPCVLLLMTACSDPRLASAQGELELVAPSPLRFPTTFVGSPTETTVELRNKGRFARDVVVRVPAPFATEGSLRLAAGEVRPLALHFDPASEGLHEGTLELESEGARRSLLLEGEAHRVPDCDSRNPCVTRHFDAATGVCVDSAVADGQACTSGCVAQGACQSGQCVGGAVTCDDGDACTVDACGESTGCVHLPVVCPAPSACQVGACGPDGSCGTAPVADGTSCGRAGCDVQDVSISGSCVARAPPEGAACGHPSPCQPLGTCQAQQCVRPPPTRLAPTWTLDAGGSPRSLDVPGMEDVTGNPLVIWRDGNSYRLESREPQGSPRWSAPLQRVLSDQSLRPEHPKLATQGLILTVWPETLLRDELAARSALDGSLVWKSDLDAALRPHVGPDAGAVVFRTGRVAWTAGQLVVVAEAIAEEQQPISYSVKERFVVTLDVHTGAALSWRRVPAGESPGLIDAAGRMVWSDTNVYPASRLISRDLDGTHRWTRDLPQRTWPLQLAGANRLVLRRQDEKEPALAQLGLLDRTNGADIPAPPLVTQTFDPLVTSNAKTLFAWTFEPGGPWLSRVDLATGALLGKTGIGPGRSVQSLHHVVLTGHDTLLTSLNTPSGPAIAEFGVDGEERFFCELDAPNPWGNRPRIQLTRGYVLLYGDWPMSVLHAFSLPGYERAAPAE